MLNCRLVLDFGERVRKPKSFHFKWRPSELWSSQINLTRVLTISSGVPDPRYVEMVHCVALPNTNHEKVATRANGYIQQQHAALTKQKEFIEANLRSAK